MNQKRYSRSNPEVLKAIYQCHCRFCGAKPNEFCVVTNAPINAARASRLSNSPHMPRVRAATLLLKSQMPEEPHDHRKMLVVPQKTLW